MSTLRLDRFEAKWGILERELSRPSYHAILGALGSLYDLIDVLRDTLQICPACGHEWRRHDPEDGMCDAHSDEEGVFGACRCGRESAFTAAANARLSKLALSDEVPAAGTT